MSRITPFHILPVLLLAAGTAFAQTEVTGNSLNIYSHSPDSANNVLSNSGSAASGSWSETSQAWEEERKAVYEYDDAGMKEVVSFYNKSVEEWIRDKFTNHPLFINPAEKWQQNSMRFYYYETYFHEGNVNQFEIRYIYTEAPVYLSEPENKEHVTGVFPNPGTDHVKVSAGVDNAVVRFYDLQGRLRDARPFDFSTTINAGGWPAGVYLWEIWRDDQKLGSGKWVKN